MLYRIAKLLGDHALAMRDFIFDLLFPIECINCGQGPEWLCRECFRLLKFNSTHNCLGCNKQTSTGEYCPECREQYPLNGVWVGGQYEYPLLKKLIKYYKYNFVSDLDRTLGQFLSLYFLNLKNSFLLSTLPKYAPITNEHLKKIIKAPQALLDPESTGLMPVPLHKKRLLWRGFNQAERLAIILASRFGLKYSPENLIRKRYDKPQAKLNKHKRLCNITDNFSWTGKRMIGKNIILVDDVATTGATLNECARVLKGAGANEVWGLVLARG